MQEFFKQYFSLVKKYIPLRPQEPAIGLDIGIRYCKAVELLRTKEGFKVLNWAVEPIAGADISSSVKNLLKKIGSESRNVYTAVSGQGTLIRFIKMPRMPVAQLKESLSLEADKYFPFPANEIYMDCQIVDDKKNKENKMSVLVAVAKKDIIKDRLTLISSLALAEDVIGLDAVAISNAVIEFQKNGNGQVNGKKKETFAVIDLGESKTTLIIFRDNASRFIREISIGGKDFTQKIIEALHCNLHDAENIKYQPGERQEEVFAACQSVLLNLVSEIRLSFDYFASEESSEAKTFSGHLNPEDSSHVSKLFLTGDNARLVKAKEFFSKELEIPVDIWMPLADLEFSENVSRDKFLENINQLSVALGLSVTTND